MSRIDSRREGILVADRWHFLDSGLTEDGSHDLIPVTCETGADPVGLHIGEIGLLSHLAFLLVEAANHFTVSH
jgi:hypothetical protein